MYLAAILTTLINIITSYIISIKSNVSRNFWISFGLFIAFFYSFIYGLRTIQSGTDTKYYSSAFSYLLSEDYYWEPGFQSLTQLIHSISNNPHFYVYILALINCLAIFFAAFFSCNRRWFIIPVLQVTIYSSFTFFDLTTNALRQGIGLTVGLTGAALYLYRSKYLGLLVLFTSILFHSSAAILLISIILATILTNIINRHIIIEQLYYLLIITIVSLTIIGHDIFGVFMKPIIPMVEHQSYFMLRKATLAITSYSEISIGSFGALNLSGKLVRSFTMLFPIIFYLYHRKKYNVPLNQIFITYSLLLLIYCTMAHQGFSYRYNYILNIFTPILFFEIFNIRAQRNLRGVYTILILIATFYSCIFIWFSKQGVNFEYGL